jgi:hypothetical protein
MVLVDRDYKRAEERIKKELDADKLADCKNATEVKQLLLEYFKEGDWYAKKSNKFVTEMTKRVSEYGKIGIEGYEKPVPIKDYEGYFKTVAQRKGIEYEIREDGKVRFKRVDGSMSRWHTYKMSVNYIRKRKVVNHG